MSNTTKKTTTAKKTNSKAKTTAKTATKTATKPKTNPVDNELEALKEELKAKIAMLDAQLAATKNENLEPVNHNEEITTYVEPNPNQKTKVYSMVFGLFTIHCPTRGFTEFKEYGTFKILSYAQLLDYMLTCSESFKQGRIYISDPQIVEALGLTEYYEELFSMNFVNDIIKGKVDVDQIHKVISNSNDKQKQSLGYYIAILAYEGKFNDYNIINELEKATGVEINRKIAEMREFAANSGLE